MSDATDFPINNNESGAPVQQQRIRSKYPKLTPKQAAEAAKPIDHEKLCKSVRQSHRKTQEFVAEKFTQDAKAVWFDKGA